MELPKLFGVHWDHDTAHIRFDAEHGPSVNVSGGTVSLGMTLLSVKALHATLTSALLEKQRLGGDPRVRFSTSTE